MSAPRRGANDKWARLRSYIIHQIGDCQEKHCDICLPIRRVLSEMSRIDREVKSRPVGRRSKR